MSEYCFACHAELVPLNTFEIYGHSRGGMCHDCNVAMHKSEVVWQLQHGKKDDAGEKALKEAQEGLGKAWSAAHAAWQQWAHTVAPSSR
jgi:hypothetical protein